MFERFVKKATHTVKEEVKRNSKQFIIAGIVATAVIGFCMGAACAKTHTVTNIYIRR